MRSDGSASRYLQRLVCDLWIPVCWHGYWSRICWVRFMWTQKYGLHQQAAIVAHSAAGQVRERNEPGRHLLDRYNLLSLLERHCLSACQVRLFS